MPRVCLSSICRAPPEAVAAMLASAAPYVDEAVVVVAGELAREELRCHPLPVPTTVIAHPWRGHAATRTVALHAAEARAEWVLTLDHSARYASGGSLPDLEGTVSAYSLRVVPQGGQSGGMVHRRPHLTRRGHGWRFEGCGSSGLHEALYGDGAPRVDRHDGLIYLTGPPNVLTAERYREHARLLHLAAEEDPTHHRTAFYLAQSLRDAANLSPSGGTHAELGAALAAYVRRGNMSGGCAEENFRAWLEAGDLAWRIGLPWEAAIAFVTYALTWGPRRAEPHALLARLYAAWGNRELAAVHQKAADACPWPAEAQLFVDAGAYREDVRPVYLDPHP